MALIFDVGMFGIFDFGFLFVWVCVQDGVKVECLFGVIVFVLVFVVLGIFCDKFYFEGFLFYKKGC